MGRRIYAIKTTVGCSISSKFGYELILPFLRVSKIMRLGKNFKEYKAHVSLSSIAFERKAFAMLGSRCTLEHIKIFM
jgi:hypothetical protein